MPRGTLVYRFGEFELHAQGGRLLRAGQRVRLGSIPTAILIRLIADAPHVVEKSAIERAGWGGTASLSSLEKAVSRVRHALQDTDGSRYVETVPFRGYRFIGRVSEVDSLDAAVHGRDRAFRWFEGWILPVEPILQPLERELSRINRFQGSSQIADCLLSCFGQRLGW